MTKPSKPEHPLAVMQRELNKELIASGLTVGDLEQRTDTTKSVVTFIPRGMTGRRHRASEMEPDIMTGFQATFIPGASQSEPKVECPNCLGTSTIDHLGRCHACWGDIFGLCEECGSILEENRSCSICNGEDKSSDQAD